MSKGYVYILSNPSMPGIVKIGKTTRTIEARAQELFQTGVPTPFEVVYWVFTPNCADLEASVHKSLSSYRLCANREFFNIDHIKAMSVLDICHQEEVAFWLDEYLPNTIPVECDLNVGEDVISALADELMVPAPDVAVAMSMITAAELMPSLERWYGKLDDNRRKREGVENG